MDKNDRSEIIDLKRLLSRLSKEDRALIYMIFYPGYTLDEIAQIVEKPQGTVRTRTLCIIILSLHSILKMKCLKRSSRSGQL